MLTQIFLLHHALRLNCKILAIIGRRFGLPKWIIASLLITVRKEGPNHAKIYFLPGILKIQFLAQDVNFGVAALAMTADFSNRPTKLQLLSTRTLVQVVDTILTCLLFLHRDQHLSQ
jgi:hypothetical protein